MKPEIAVLDAATLGADLDLSPLSGVGCVTVYPNTSPDEVQEKLADTDVCIINKVKLGEKNLAGCSRLKLICIAATGYDNVDTEYCRRAGIAVCNVVGYSTESVAQLTAGMVLYLANRTPDYVAAVKSGSYSSGTTANILTPVYHELCGKTWGIAGYGHIGRRVGEIARAFGCRVIAYRRTPDPDCTDIDTLCRESDILSVHLPLNDGTRNLFSAEKISMLRSGCIFINVARGAVCDEKALADAVLAGRLGGLGVDVYTKEPFPAGHPYTSLLSLDNVILTPHCAWGSYEARCRCLEEIILNIRAFYSGSSRCRVD